MTTTGRDSDVASENTSTDQAVIISASPDSVTTSLRTLVLSSSTTVSTSWSGTTSRTNGVSASTKAISSFPVVATANVAATSGVLIIALLVYAMYQRRRGATFSEIARFRHHYSSTIGFSPAPRDARLTALPIYRETRYSVRSSQHASLASFQNPARYTAPRAPPQPLPREVTQKSHLQNPYLRNLWKTAHPPSVPGTPLRETHSAMEDETVPVRKPEKARFASYRLSGRSFVTQQSIAETAKSSPESSVTERPLSNASVVPPTPPDTPYSRRNLRDHW
ncbi:hypothetical protein LTR33_015280, partial [Friedmanniomyces endolithicus]